MAMALIFRDEPMGRNLHINCTRSQIAYKHKSMTYNLPWEHYNLFCPFISLVKIDYTRE